jgi:hypothetical protein
MIPQIKRLTEDLDTLMNASAENVSVPLTLVARAIRSGMARINTDGTGGSRYVTTGDHVETLCITPDLSPLHYEALLILVEEYILKRVLHATPGIRDLLFALSNDYKSLLGITE